MGKSKKHESKSKTKHKRKERNEKKKKTKKRSKEKKGGKERKTRDKLAAKTEDQGGEDFSIPVDLMNSKSHAPETPEEYQQRQNRMRREIDPVTGRSRLIKGDGEVLEEIVSRERHKAVNKEATKADGDFFQKNTVNKFK